MVFSTEYHNFYVKFADGWRVGKRWYLIIDTTTPIHNLSGVHTSKLVNSYLTALWKYLRASWKWPWPSSAWPTLLNSLALRWLTFKPAMKMLYSEVQSQLRQTVFVPWASNKRQSPPHATCLFLDNRMTLAC